MEVPRFDPLYDTVGVDIPSVDHRAPTDCGDLSAGLRSLPARDRRALHLVEVDGASYQDAASELGITRDQVRVLVFQSRRALFGDLRQGSDPRRRF